jgi:hypothetical protein
MGYGLPERHWLSASLRLWLPLARPHASTLLRSYGMNEHELQLPPRRLIWPILWLAACCFIDQAMFSKYLSTKRNIGTGSVPCAILLIASSCGWAGKGLGMAGWTYGSLRGKKGKRLDRKERKRITPAAPCHLDAEFGIKESVGWVGQNRERIDS